MKSKKNLLLLIITISSFSTSAFSQNKDLVVRIAKLQIDSAQLESYRGMLKEEIETSVRVEPGVLSLNAVYEKNNPTHVTIMEIYANVDAYRSHLETPHFKKYKSGTVQMVKALELVEATPIALSAKPKIQ
jgi:quinol monooxygenase YgiN